MKSVILSCFVILLLIFTSCSETSENTTAGLQKTPLQTPTGKFDAPPYAFYFLENQTLEFNCGESDVCFEDIDFGPILEDATIRRIHTVYYASPSSLWIPMTLDNSRGYRVTHFDLGTGTMDSIELPMNGESILTAVVQDYIVLGQYNQNHIIIVNNEMEVKEIDLGNTLHHLIESRADEVIAFNSEVISSDRSPAIEVSSIDVTSGEVTKNMIVFEGFDTTDGASTPQPGHLFLRNVAGVSTDLDRAFCFFIDGSEPEHPRLGIYDVSSRKVIAATEDQELAGLLIPYMQHRDFLFTHFIYDTEAPSQARLLDMTNLTSILPFEDTETDKAGEIIIVPRYESFLIQTYNNVLVLNIDGEITQEYPLDKTWTYEDLHFVNYR